MRRVDLTVEETYYKLKADYQAWHRGCQACAGEGDYSFACNLGNYLYKGSDFVKVYIFTGGGQDGEVLAEILLLDGRLILKNDPRWYVAPWVTPEDVLSILGG